MHFEHFIITLFCFRGKEAFKKLLWPGFNFHANPLKPKYLEHRLRLFKMTCLPGILSQTNQNFNWIIIIDKELDPDIKKELESLIQNKQRAFLHEFKEGTDIGSTKWLAPYFTKNPDYVLASNHDDDDILPPNFVASMQEHIREKESIGRLPAVKLIGANQILQWDLINTKQSPLGWKGPWHRGYYPSSCGFSMLSKYPEANLNVLGYVHRRAEEYIDFETTATFKHITFNRNRIIEALYRCNENESTWSKEDLFYDISNKCGPVLMTNHSHNAQFARLYETKDDYSKVTGPESFPEFAIDWALVQKNIKYFKKNIPLLVFKEVRQRIKKLKLKTIRSVRQIFSS